MAGKESDFGHLLSALREERGWSQKELAEQSRISLRTISSWENAHATPHRDSVDILVTNLGFPPGRTNLFLEAAGYDREFAPQPILGLPRKPREPFIGRKAILDELHNCFPRLSRAVQALTGPDGMGKTEIALKYASKHAGKYDVIWWIRADDPRVALEDYAALARKIGLPVKKDRKQTAGDVLHWLDRHDHWLIVLDDAPGPEQVHQYLPQKGSGHVLVISQNPNWPQIGHCLPVSVFTPVEASEFLRQRTGGKVGTDAEALAETLGYLPLALEQAAVYMETAGLDARAYLILYRANPDVLSFPKHEREQITLGLARSFQISLARAWSEYPAAVDLLNLCAFLAPDDIPTQLLAGRVADFSPELADAAMDETWPDKAVHALLANGLVTAQDDRSLAIHSLFQQMARQRFLKHGRCWWIEAATELVLGAYPVDGGGAEDWASPARLLRHILKVAEHIRSLDEDSQNEVLAKWGYDMGRVLRDLGELERAGSWLEDTLKILEPLRGSDHPSVLAVVNELGRVSQERGDLQEARGWYERALRGYKLARGAQDPMVGTVSTNLGDTCFELGDYTEARTHHEEALDIAREVRGPRHPDVARALNNLGIVLASQGDCERAASKYREALEIDEAIYGPDHPLTGKTVGNLGLALQSQGRMEEARAQLERAWHIAVKSYGPDHLEVARTAYNLATVLQDSQARADLEAAREYLRQALKIDDKRLGSEHPNLAGDLLRLGEVLLALEEPSDPSGGALAEARACIERALRIDMQASGQPSGAVGDDWSALGRVVRAQGDMVKAREYFELALEADEAAFGPDHPAVARDRYNLGDLARAEGDLETARNHLARAQHIFEASMGSDHPHAIATRKELEELDRPSATSRQ